jgi:membrane peptidoglycan carboxypeptidase
VLTFEEAIVKSSNVGAIKVGLRTGAERLTKYVHRFGFGEVLAPDFMGQSRGIWNAAALNESGLASVSMGYQVSVTPLQMATAASAIANGGLLMEPRVVRAMVTNGRREAVTPKVIRRAVTAETAAILRTMMEGVVDHGTATRAQLPGHLSAGKTGTAHKIDGRRYSDTDFNASFVGFVPSRSPAFTILVVIDTPRAGTHYGGTVPAADGRHRADRQPAAARHRPRRPRVAAYHAGAGDGDASRDGSRRRRSGHAGCAWLERARGDARAAGVRSSGSTGWSWIRGLAVAAARGTHPARDGGIAATRAARPG